MVSVFIPVYNGEQYLPRTLDSVLGQSYADLEVLCVDDTSFDNSYAILQEYASHDSRIRVFQKPNGGTVPRSWEYVIPFIKGDFVLYMSQDDLLETDSLQQMVAVQKETKADTVVAREYLFFENRKENSRIPFGIPELLDQVIDGKDALRLILDYQIPGFALWNTTIVKNIGVSTETFNGDELAQRQWIARSQRVAFSRGVFLYRCDNPQAITKHHSPLHYESILTDARLLLFVEKELVGENQLLNELANLYFEQLLKLMMLFLQKKGQYSKSERKHIKPFFYKAYSILRSRESLPDKKYRISKQSFSLMWIMAVLKTIQYRKRGVEMTGDMDKGSILTPRKYLQTFPTGIKTK